MKNIDKIRAMSAEELYEFDKEGMCHKCIYHRQDGCDNTEPIATKSYHNVCKKGYILWLNQEVNPMPELQVGDIIVVLLDKGLINKIVVGLVVVSDKLASDLNGVMYNLNCLNIRVIKRMNNTNERVEVLWRADND